ncbi:MAG: hypothetical protein JWR39_1608 [Devosia sp.]|nr:hypothetical protein [Devosia sp.]
MGKVVAWGVACLLATALLGACTPRPTGDFGRARPSYTHDVALPAVGRVFADARDEPVSSFNLTDQEEEMHNRVWRFLVAPHAKDWFFDFATELQRTRIAAELDSRFGVDRYYLWLHNTAYQSSPVRYSTVGRHIAADLDTLPDTFAAICAVIEVDRQRALAAAELRSIGPLARADMLARRAENNTRIDWFVRALGYRYGAYNYALDQLLVETPHAQSMAVDEALRRLAGFVSRAERRDFCAGVIVAGGERGRAALPSRYESQWIDREVVDQK